MSSLIETIKEAEERAKSIRAEAQASGRDMLLEANMNGAELVAKTTDDMRQRLANAKEEAEFEGQKLARQIIANAELEAIDFVRAAEANVRKCSDFIFERLCES